MKMILPPLEKEGIHHPSLWDRRTPVLSGEKPPPVLPIVLYNGAPRWNAPVEVSELIAHVASPSPEKMKEIVIALMEWLNFPEQQHLVRAFIVWFRRVLCPDASDEIPRIENLQEAKTMLAENAVLTHDI